MYELETRLKLFGDTADPETDFTITLEAAREIREKFQRIRTALRRIEQMDRDTAGKLAAMVANQALADTHG